MANTKSNNSDMKQIGVLFKNTSKKGATYFSGNIDNQKVVGFLNSFTTKDGKEMTVINLYEATEADASKGTKKTTKTKGDIPF